jgi:GrpB-like predicted nucleotidyltransferase (UPF0157 family)
VPLRTIVVVPYDPSWADRYRVEEAALRALLGAELLAVHHVGSTAVPGLASKPIIDILAEVRAIETMDRLAQGMEAIGYRAMGEYGIPGRRFFVKGPDDARACHLHAFGAGHPRIGDHLAFRDYLRGHPDAALAYGRLKEELARRFPHDIDAYMAGKEPAIRELLRRAGAADTP